MRQIPLYGVILAGGWGTRFWPLSRSQYPKQVLRLLGSESMLQTTVERLLPRIPANRLAVVTNADQAELIHQELHGKGWDEVRIWIEPEGRNTAAAVGLAAVYLEEEAEEALMAVFPADHFIRDQASLLQALDLGAVWAQAGYLVTFGIPPTRPETGYGYIKQGAPLDDQGRVYRAARFIEKPPLARAQEFVAAGGYYWNSGIFVFRRDVLLDRLFPISAGAVPATGPAPGQGEPATPCRSLSTVPQRLFGSRHPGEGRQRGGGAGRDGLERRGDLGSPARTLPPG